MRVFYHSGMREMQQAAGASRQRLVIWNIVFSIVFFG
jgi:hypothetical protein